MQTTFTINQNLTYREFLSSTLYFYLSAKLLRRFFLLVIGLSLFSNILGLMTTSKGLKVTDFVSAIVPSVILFLMVIIFSIVICLIIYKSKPYLFHNVSYDFTHWGVVRHGEKTEFSKPWREITRVKETRAFFLLYIGRTDFHIIQKRMFGNINELDDFRSLLKEKTLKQ